METELQAISPIAFDIIKEGDIAKIEHKPPKKNEFREKIGPASECYLIFKGRTKIGMVPHNFAKNNGALLDKKYCRIKKIDKLKSKIAVSFDAKIIDAN